MGLGVSDADHSWATNRSSKSHLIKSQVQSVEAGSSKKHSKVTLLSIREHGDRASTACCYPTA